MPPLFFLVELDSETIKKKKAPFYFVLHKGMLAHNRITLYHASENTDDPGESIQFDLIQFSKYFYFMLIL